MGDVWNTEVIKRIGMLKASQGGYSSALQRDRMGTSARKWSRRIKADEKDLSTPYRIY